MDKLATQLKADAAEIDVEVSDELDYRIRASLNSVSQEPARPAAVRRRPAIFWFASSLTGIAAAAAIITILNVRTGDDMTPQATPDATPVAMSTSPIIELKTESAMLTAPLQQELEHLQSDIRKAEKKVREDIGL
tara:strand:+ start:3918 stop:4322 length:405 start_codon:yes stop_codon:yes gene_type:complete